MNESASGTERYFVRTNGRVIGPLSYDDIVKLFDRKKLGVYGEVSQDRAQWQPLSTLGERFCRHAAEEPITSPLGRELSIPVAIGQIVDETPPTIAVAVPSLSSSDDVPCFYSIDGQVNGPIPFSSVRTLARLGRLSPHDRLWLSGTVNWVEAGAMTDLVFPGQWEKSVKWTRRSPVMVTCIVLAVLLFIIGPVVLVFGLARDRAWRAQEVARLEMERQGKEEQIQREQVADLEKEKDDLVAKEERLLNQRNQMELRLEQVKLQYATLTAAAVRDNRVHDHMNDLESELRALDRQLEDVRAEVSAKFAEVKRANEELRTIQERQLAAQQRGNQLVEEGNQNLRQANESLDNIEREVKD